MSKINSVYSEIESECVYIERLLSLLCMSSAYVELGEGNPLKFSVAASELLPVVKDRVDYILDLVTKPSGLAA